MYIASLLCSECHNSLKGPLGFYIPQTNSLTKGIIIIYTGFWAQDIESTSSLILVCLRGEKMMQMPHWGTRYLTQLWMMYIATIAALLLVCVGWKERR